MKNLRNLSNDEIFKILTILSPKNRKTIRSISKRFDKIYVKHKAYFKPNNSATTIQARVRGIKNRKKYKNKVAKNAEDQFAQFLYSKRLQRMNSFNNNFN